VRSLFQRALGASTVTLMGGSGLWAARSGRTPPPAGQTQCLLDGWLLNADSLAAELGVRDDLPEAVVSAGFDRWGNDVVRRLRGSFAVVVWRPDEGTGVVAQDQLGNRAVFHTRSGGRLLFASEIDALLRLMPRRPAPDDFTVVQWLTGKLMPEERTLFEGVRRLGAGHMLRLSARTHSREVYWRPRYEPPLRGTREELVQELWRRLLDSVSARMNGAVGIIMSGGIDSAAVAAAAFESHPRGEPRPHAYSAVFPGHTADRVDESARIRTLTSALELPSFQFAIQPQGTIYAAAQYVRTWGLPLNGPGSVVEAPLMEQAISDDVDGLLDGQGGDELFGHSPYVVADRLRHGRLIRAWWLTGRFPGAGHHPAARKRARILRSVGVEGAVPFGLHARLRRWRASRHIPPFLAPHAHRAYLDGEDTWAWKRHPGPRSWAYQAHLLTRVREGYLLPDSLRHRAAEAGVEARSPLLDVDLVEFSLRLPPEMLFDPMHDRPLIRDAMNGVVPDGVRLSRIKSNLGPFYYACLGGPDLEPARRLLAPAEAKVRAYLRAEVLDGLLDDPPSASDRRMQAWLSQIWTFVTVEIWLRSLEDSAFIDRLLDDDALPRPASSLYEPR
jgi:asparagine synthase (glutamine-hydrolysing)